MYNRLRIAHNIENLSFFFFVTVQKEKMTSENSIA